MGVYAVFKDGHTESIPGSDHALYSGHLYVYDADGEVIAERDDVMSAGKVRKANQGQQK